MPDPLTIEVSGPFRPIFFVKSILRIPFTKKMGQNGPLSSIVSGLSVLLLNPLTIEVSGPLRPIFFVNSILGIPFRKKMGRNGPLSSIVSGLIQRVRSGLFGFWGFFCRIKFLGAVKIFFVLELEWPIL